jgi:Uma2 family endonuclease
MTLSTQQPAWVELFPRPGEWTEAEYFPLSDRGRIVELSNGNLEVSPLRTYLHQLILMRLSFALYAFVTQHKLGFVCIAPLPARLWPGKVREPDLMFMAATHMDRIGKYWGVPDLTVEIISPGTEKNDRETKREEYAQAGIPEFWIIDPDSKTLEVLRHNRDTEVYDLAAQLTERDTLTSPTFPGFSLVLAELFAEA